MRQPLFFHRVVMNVPRSKQSRRQTVIAESTHERQNLIKHSRRAEGAKSLEQRRDLSQIPDRVDARSALRGRVSLSHEKDHLGAAAST